MIRNLIKEWVDKVVIGHNFCPFAKKELEGNRIRYVLSETNNAEVALESLIKECEYLDEHDQTETTLLIFSGFLADFEDFLDFVEMANQLIEMQDYEGVYQLASFHPDYCFADAEQADAANYTNRSPYPMLHLLRESSLERAIEHYPGAEKIPENNIQLATEKGAKYFQDILNNIKKE